MTPPLNPPNWLLNAAYGFYNGFSSAPFTKGAGLFQGPSLELSRSVSFFDKYLPSKVGLGVEVVRRESAIIATQKDTAIVLDKPSKDFIFAKLEFPWGKLGPLSFSGVLRAGYVHSQATVYVFTRQASHSDLRAISANFSRFGLATSLKSEFPIMDHFGATLEVGLASLGNHPSAGFFKLGLATNF